MFCCCKDNEKIANISVFLSFLKGKNDNEKENVSKQY